MLHYINYLRGFMLTYDRALITLLFTGYVGKLLLNGAQLADAPIALILATCYFLFFYKLREKEITELKQELSRQQVQINEIKIVAEDVKSGLAASKIGQGFRSVK